MNKSNDAGSAFQKSRRAQNLCKLIAHAFIAALVMSFIYLLVWGVIIKGLSAGVSVQDAFLMSEKRGFSQFFIHSTLYICIVGSGIFMYLTSTISTLSMKRNIPNEDQGNTASVKERILKQINKVLFVNGVAYALLMAYFFFILMHQFFFQSPIIFGVEVPFIVISFPLVVLAIILQRKSIFLEREAFCDIVEVINLILENKFKDMPNDVKEIMRLELEAGKK